MQSWNRRISPTAGVLAVLISLFLSGAAIWSVYADIRHIEKVTADMQSFIISPNGLSNRQLFILGQHYFNDSNSPNGPYDLKRARMYYEALISRSPTADALLWYQLGRIDFLEGKFDLAVFRFKKQLEHFGNAVPAVHYMLGLTYAYRAEARGDTEDWESAEEHFRTLVPLSPEDPWIRTDLAWILFMQGKYSDMKPLLEEVIDQNTGNAWVHNMYGLALFNTGSVAEARSHFLRAAAISSQLTARDWGRAYPGNDPRAWQHGLEEMQKAIERNLALTMDEVS